MREDTRFFNKNGAIVSPNHIEINVDKSGKSTMTESYIDNDKLLEKLDKQKKEKK